MTKSKSKPTAEGGSGGNEANFINKNAQLIEQTLEAFGIFVKVAEMHILDMYHEYYLDVAVGTNFGRLEKLNRELAMALASPTGKVYWQIPIPGRALVGLRVPRPPKKYSEEIEKERQKRWRENTLRTKIAFGFYLLGQLNYFIAYKILGDHKPDELIMED